MVTKRKLGIVGGMGSRAGARFLNMIIDYSPALTDQDFLEIIFHNNSAAPDRTRAIIYDEPSPLGDILKSVGLFNENGIEVMALACITSYYYYDQIKAHAASKVINPLHLLAGHIKERYAGVKRIGVLATTGTIGTGLFHAALKGIGAGIITLAPHDQEELFMRAVYMNGGFKSAKITEEAGSLMNRAVEKLIAADVQLIIGGCTEVSIAIDPVLVPIPFIDTLDLLARKTVAYCYDKEMKSINGEVYG